MSEGVDLSANRDLLLDHERQVARAVAGDVVDRPELAMWMILIPVFFVFYFFQLKRYKNGLKEFSRNFLISRERALDWVHDALRKQSQVDIDELAAQSDSPVEVRNEYRLWMEALVDHFQTLIAVPGSTYEELVRNGYRKKTSYQRALERLNRTEREFNRALASHLPGDQESIAQVVEAMISSVKTHRRSMVDKVFN